MKKLCLLLCLLLCFTGCSPGGGTELSDRLIIEAVGIDSTENGYRITALALHTQQTGSANSTETPDGIGKIYTAEDESIAGAFGQLNLLSGMVPLYSQARVLVLGREIAENEPMQALNFFIRNFTIRDNILLAVADTTAQDLVGIDLGKNQLASILMRNILETGKNNGLTVAVPLYRFVNQMLAETDSAFLPIFKVRKNAQEKEEIQAAGIALFSKDSFTLTLEQTQLRGLLWAADNIDTDFWEVSYNNHNISLSVRKCNAEITLSDTKTPAFLIRVSFSCDIIEYNTAHETTLSVKDITNLTQIAQQQVENNINTFLQTTMREKGCDCLQLGRKLKALNPKLYKTVIDNYPEFLKTVPVAVKVTARIFQTG